MFALLRDKFKSGKTEQAHELKDTQRLKKHLQQVTLASDGVLNVFLFCFLGVPRSFRLEIGNFCDARL